MCIKLSSYLLKSGCEEVFAKLEILLNLVQFKKMMPDSLAVYLDPDCLILYELIDVPVASILSTTAQPQIVIRWTG